jgi:predicted aspartyl protease
MKSPSLWSLRLAAALAVPSFVPGEDLPGVEIPFRLHGHLIVVEGCSIGDLEGLNFVLDTGAGITVVRPEIARKLGLRGDSRDVATYGRRERVRDVLLPTVRWGELEFDEVPAVAARLGMARMERRLRVDALIGLSLLRRSSVTVDYERKVLVFGPVAHSGPWTPFYGGLPFIIVPTFAGDQRLNLSLDTGAADVILYGHRAEGRIRMKRTSERRPAVYVGGKSTLRKVYLPEVTVAETLWEEVPAFLLDGRSPQQGLDGLLGVSGLGLKKLHLDFDRNRVGWER